MTGGFNLPFDNFQNGETINASDFNANSQAIEDEIDDINDELATKLSGSGGTMTGELDMDNNKITNIANGTNGLDAVNVSQLSGKVNKSGDTLSGTLNMGTYKIINCDSGTNSSDVATVSQIPDISVLLPLTGGTMTGNIDMSSNKITGLADGSVSGDAIHFGQFSSSLASTGSHTSPTGLTIKWGIANPGVGGTFVTPFVSTCLFVLVSAHTTESLNIDGLLQYVTTKNTSGFSTSSQDYYRSYIAIGY
jgi:hypothetical protein